MKTYIIASAIVCGSLTVSSAKSSATAASTQDASTTLMAVLQDGYKEVLLNEVPQKIHDAIKLDFKGGVVTKAYKNDKSEFKLIVSTPDGAKQTVLTNSMGEWLKKQ